MFESEIRLEELRAQTSGAWPTTSVCKCVRVAASLEHAFAVFTTEVDRWWPRTPLGGWSIDHVVIEGRAGGAVLCDQRDGRSDRWGTVLAWDPPHRFVMTWQLAPTGISEPDLAKSSEVEVTFRQDDGGLATVVELEHRGLERHIVSRVETIASPIKGRARRAQCNRSSRASLM